MEEDFENDGLDMEDGEGLDFDILTSNIEAILDEPEMKKLLEEIGEDKDTIISEIISDMESENKGVDFSDDEKQHCPKGNHLPECRAYYSYRCHHVRHSDGRLT